MSLTKINRKEFSDTDTVIVEVRGWDVTVTQHNKGYQVHVALFTDSDGSDQMVLVLNDTAPSASVAKEMVKDAIDNAGITAKRAQKLADKVQDFGILTVQELLATAK